MTLTWKHCNLPYKKPNMTKYKTDMNITKIQKYKKLNMTEHKTDMNITEIDKYQKNEQHFYYGTQNNITTLW